MKEIIIHYDSVHEKSLSYEQVKDAIVNNVEEIHTNCLSFFDFRMFDYDYNVIIISRIGYIDMKELLNGDITYTYREIRRSHNIYKMFLANSFEWNTWDLE